MVSADRKAVGQIDQTIHRRRRKNFGVSRSESRWPDRRATRDHLIARCGLCQPIGKPLARSTAGQPAQFIVYRVSADRKAVGQIDFVKMPISDANRACQPIGKPLARSTECRGLASRGDAHVSADRKAVGQID